MNSSHRPKIKIPFTVLDTLIEWVGVLLLVCFWNYTIVHYTTLPEIIPTHFGAQGKPDGYGEKWMILSLPVIGTILYMGLTLASYYPHTFNYMVTITEKNAVKQYTIAKKMIRIMKVSLILVFFLLDIHTIRTALNYPDILGKWFLLVLFALIFIPLFYFLIQFSKNS